MEAAPLSFAQQVRALRLRSGLTQAELAERAGISERTVSDLERGLRTSLYAATARGLAEALRVPNEARPAFLLAASGDPGRHRAPAAVIEQLPLSYRSRLPAALTRLIGRDDDLAGVSHLLAEEGVRLVTIVGPAGVGKTRLAIDAARGAAARLGAAAYFIDLSAIDEAASVLPTVASSIGLPVVTGDVLPQLATWLGDQRVVLLLDTMEHVLGAAPAVAQLVSLCPRLSVLVTSRAPLKLRAERQWPLRPLHVDVESGTSPGGAPAVELFLERARQSSPDALGDDLRSAAIAAMICARLDGLPLAIELAAARIRHMSLEALSRSLDNRLAVLVGGHRDAPSRHQTMRAAIQWSHGLLSEAEQRVFRALSVFRGGFTAEALASVLMTDTPATMDALHGLVDASLVVFEHGRLDPRYRLLDVVAEFALEQAIAAGEGDELQRRHAQHVLRLARQAEAQLHGDGQREWLRRLLDEEGNVRAAMTWSLRTGETETALQLGGALWMFWR